MRVSAFAGFISGLVLISCSAEPGSKRASTVFRDYLRKPRASMIAYTSRISAAGQSRSAAIRQELQMLRPKFDGLALYGFDEDTPLILAAARELRYQAVLLTISDPRAEAEIATAANLCEAYTGQLALAVSIGSEGLFENRYSFNDVGSAAKSLERRWPRAERFEITTSEPWWRFLNGQPQAKRLRAFGEFVTVNVHVVWDADIVDPVEAARWTKSRSVEIMNLSGRPVLVREAGFPGGGTSPRSSLAGAAFSREAQARFWREWVHTRSQNASMDARRFVSQAAVFEAIDNPRKAWCDFESSWGLLSSDLRPYPAWEVFPVLEDPTRDER
jgi:exo-beta-1,3-glucanase (GH17 family)